jgi:hypothetical protein
MSKFSKFTPFIKNFLFFVFARILGLKLIRILIEFVKLPTMLEYLKKKMIIFLKNRYFEKFDRI